MQLQAGRKIGPYEILAFIGAGGMGEVYKARDLRIGREVAIKILPQEFAENEDRLSRFRQEAQSAGMLNHPNVVAIHDLGVDGSRPYLVCELLEGETLRQRLQTGRIPRRKAIEYAMQIASGLTAAHEKGIVHRDLKPENIFITRDGRVKILDFGLAKLLEAEHVVVDRSQLQTAAPQSTPGTILGTIGYMSPEQVRGIGSDHRSDIFAFGTILYEMLMGKRAFHGETHADTLSAILQKEPSELSESNPDLTQAMGRLLQHCLEKNPEERLQSMRDVRFYLETLSGLSESSVATSVLPPARQPVSRLLPWGIAALFALTTLVVAVRSFLISKESQPSVALSINAPLEPSFNATQGAMDMALSPDGKHLVFPELNENKRVVLWDRALNDPNPRALKHTEDATYPFWSPDSRYIGFFADSKLKVIDIQSGVVRVLCDVPAGRGGSWNRKGTILFAPDKFGGLYRIGTTGGQAEPVGQKPPESTTFRWPCFLPDDNHFLFTSGGTVGTAYKAAVLVGSLDSSKTKLLIEEPSNALFTPPDTVVFAQNGRLVARKLDLKSFEWIGETLTISNQSVVQNLARAYAAFTVSEGGALAYQAELIPPSKLMIVDRSGKTVEEIGEAAYYQSPRFSPDGKRISVLRNELHMETADFWLLDRVKGTMSRFTSRPDFYGSGAWSSDGSTFYFGWNKLYRKASSGATAEEVLYESAFGLGVSDISPDGKYLAIGTEGPRSLEDILVFPLNGHSGTSPYLNTPANDTDPKFSPDGRYMAYSSDESGKSEIYVRPFPGAAGGKWQVSTDGGSLPVWNRNGKELFYLSRGRMMAVPVSLQPNFESGTPTVLFATAGQTLADDAYFDVSPDGQHFVVSTPPEARYFSSVTVILNWRNLIRD